MASTVQLGGVDADRIFIDTDFTRDFAVLDLDADRTGATAKQVTGLPFTLDIRPRDHSSAPPIISFSIGSGLSIIGTFNSVAASNTERIRWTCADTDLTTALFSIRGGTFRYSLKRTTPGSEVIIQRGDIVIERATQA